jgi:hypothetical protein
MRRTTTPVLWRAIPIAVLWHLLVAATINVLLLRESVCLLYVQSAMYTHTTTYIAF